MPVTGYTSFMRQKRDQERSRENSQMQTPYNRNTANVKCKKQTIPIITAATGATSKSFR
jgi:hypothetical protein